MGASHAFALQNQGIAQVADRIVDAVRPDATPAMRQTIAISLMLAVAAAFGYSATRHSLAGAIGRPVSAALDREARQTLAKMVHSFIIGVEVS